MGSFRCIAMLVLTATLLSSFPARAKRTASPWVAPIVADGVIYKASHRLGVLHSRDSIIEVWDERKKTKLREVVVYTVRYREELETDVQDDFIARMQKDGHRLVLTSERGARYVVDLSTFVVKPMPVDS